MAICTNCNGILQNNISPFDIWFHVRADAFKICGKIDPKPDVVYDREIDTENPRDPFDILNDGSRR